MIDYWRQHVETGHRVIALHPIVDGRCACGKPECLARPANAGKHPVSYRWQETPVWSEEQCDAHEENGTFKHGYGVIVDGLLVVDVDERNGGLASLDKLCRIVDVRAASSYQVLTGSGNGSRHLYFELRSSVALMQTHPEFPGIDFKSVGFVVGAGSTHLSGGVYTVEVGDPYDIGPAPEALIEMLRKPERIRARIDGELCEVAEQDISHALMSIDPDCGYEQWIRCGMAIHEATSGNGVAIWDAWSRGGRKYPGVAAIERHWHSFGKSINPVGLGTLFHYASEAGWIRPDHLLPRVVEEVTPDGLPFPIDNVDLNKPPGFVGLVADWIDKQCRFPRPRLCTATALWVVGNCGGMRYTDDLYGASANLFVFGVSGSSTGKEAIQESANALLRAAGVAGALHGSIKSEQEIVRNIVRHQAAFYLIDEFGIRISKIINAQKRGGAPYLDGVIGELMSLYSKAWGHYLVTGDLKEDVKESLRRDLAREIKRAQEGGGEAAEAAVKHIEGLIDGVDGGLRHPFLSLAGFTTPSTFKTIMTSEQAMSGFLGRAILVEERDTNPRPRKGFKATPMPEGIAYTLRYLAGGISGKRVEWTGDIVSIPTTDEAAVMLERAYDWVFDVLAERHKETSGLEAVVRRMGETVAKISLILAIPEGIRTAEHVRWAFAYAERDVRDKIRAVVANEGEGLTALQARILGVITCDHGETMAVIRNRCRPSSEADVRSAVEELVKIGRVEEYEDVHGRTGKRLTKYRSTC